jgi:hypothetical protein
MVKFNSVCSESFTVKNGVRQGGILSPILFNVYMNDLSDMLNNSNVGCKINGQSLNHLFYADDSVIIAPSPNALQKLLLVCEEFASHVELTYNTKKTFCMCIKPMSYKELITPKVYLNGAPLLFISKHKYLGFIITDDLTDNSDMKRIIRTLYVQGNKLGSYFKNCTDDVKVKLFQSYCYSFYGLNLWCKFTNVCMQKVTSAYKPIFSNLFRVKEKI